MLFIRPYECRNVNSPERETTYSIMVMQSGRRMRARGRAPDVFFLTRGALRELRSAFFRYNSVMSRRFLAFAVALLSHGGRPKPGSGCLLALAAASLIVGLGVASVAGAATPGFVLDPTQGAPFTQVSFSGTNFCATAECGSVSVTIADQTVATDIDVAPDGSFQGQFEVPSIPAGWQRVVARQTLSGISITALFFVSPNVAPASGPPLPSVTAGPEITETPEPSASPPATGPETTVSPSATITPATGPESTASPSATIAPAPSSPNGDDGGWDWLPWVIVVAAVIALAAAGLILLQRARSR
jgi:hypothetical protein